MNMAKGFSLIELLISLSLISLTATIGIPVASKFIQQQKVTSDLYSVVRMINLARTEAIKTKKTVDVCGLNSNDDCHSHWIKLAILEQEERSSKGHQPLHQTQLTGNYRSAQWSSFQRSSKLSFNASGFSNHLNGSLYLCHAKHPELNRAIRVSKSGKTTIISNYHLLSERCSVE